MREPTLRDKFFLLARHIRTLCETRGCTRESITITGIPESGEPLRHAFMAKGWTPDESRLCVGIFCDYTKRHMNARGELIPHVKGYSTNVPPKKPCVLSVMYALVRAIQEKKNDDHDIHVFLLTSHAYASLLVDKAVRERITQIHKNSRGKLFIQVWHLSELLYCPLHHQLVSPHEAVDPTSELQRQLCLARWSDLPHLPESDIICRWHGFTRGTIVCVTTCDSLRGHMKEYRYVT
jgi:DNA-directed RNA polymerase subunit H (RpoH/RPB5)